MAAVGFSYNPRTSSLILDDGVEISFSDPLAFKILSDAWVRLGWEAKYVYGFSWLGRPIIQLPEDMFRIQEVISQIKPDVIIETGIAHGGSLIFYASLCAALGKGRVIGVDIEIRPHNRSAIMAHRLSQGITLIEGSSVSQEVVDKVKGLVGADEIALVILDSNHSKSHVLQELMLYSPLVAPGSYIVACDGIMKELVGAPRSCSDWGWNNPIDAINEFLQSHSSFESVEPLPPFNEGFTKDRVTYWPGAFLRRKT